jgi:hypothetical protein
MMTTPTTPFSFEKYFADVYVIFEKPRNHLEVTN